MSTSINMQYAQGKNVKFHFKQCGNDSGLRGGRSFYTLDLDVAANDSKGGEVNEHHRVVVFLSEYSLKSLEELRANLTAGADEILTEIARRRAVAAAEAE